MTPAEERVISEIKGTNLTYMIRPCFIGWGIYRPLGINRAEVILTSENKEDLRKVLRAVEVKYV